jgi:hypothetical protein
LANGLIGHNGVFLGQGTNAFILDEFRTRNQFMGAQLGFQTQLDNGRMFCRLRGSLGVGFTHQEVTIFGNTTITSPDGAVATFPGGVLAQPTNGGHFTHDEVALLPEGEITFGLHLTTCIDFVVGYNFLYWSDVIRPGDAVDRTINPTQLQTSIRGTGLTGPARPAFTWHDSDFWAQGVNVGMQFHF